MTGAGKCGRGMFVGMDDDGRRRDILSTVVQGKVKVLSSVLDQRCRE